MVKARELCKTQAKGADGAPLQGNLLTPEELINCMPFAGRGDMPLCPQSTCGMPASINMTMVLEARGHPKLCSWLESAGWMFNQKDPDLMTQAVQLIREDEANGGGAAKDAMGSSSAGLRYRLRSVPVCSTCFCVYRTVHEVVTGVRCRGKAEWAEGVQRKRREHETRDRDRRSEQLFDWAVSRQQKSSLASKDKGISGLAGKTQPQSPAASPTNNAFSKWRARGASPTRSFGARLMACENK